MLFALQCHRVVCILGCFSVSICYFWIHILFGLQPQAVLSCSKSYAAIIRFFPFILIFLVLMLILMESWYFVLYFCLIVVLKTLGIIFKVP